MNYQRAQQLAAQQLIALQQEQDLQLALMEAQARYQKSLRDRDLVKVDLGYVAIRNRAYQRNCGFGFHPGRRDGGRLVYRADLRDHHRQQRFATGGHGG